MRHIIGFLFALAVSAALFFGAGWGIAWFGTLQSGQGMRTVAAWTDLHHVLPLTALIGTALLVGILLAVRRVSALATGLPGLALIGWSAFALLRGTRAQTYIPMSGTHFATGFSTMLSSGSLLLLGATMIIPLFLPSRWRSSVTEVEEYGDELSATSTLGLVP